MSSSEGRQWMSRGEFRAYGRFMCAIGYAGGVVTGAVLRSAGTALIVAVVVLVVALLQAAWYFFKHPEDL